MKLLFSISFSILAMTFACSQEVRKNHPQLANSAFDQKVENLLRFTVPVIGVKDLSNIQHEVYIFDTRKEEEYAVSHIPGAAFLGYDPIYPEALRGISKTDTVVLYCSVGYRSEKIGEQLLEQGYTNVLNLYGSLFEWANQNLPMVDKSGKPTKNIHTYNRNWSKWVDKNKVEKKVW